MPTLAEFFATPEAAEAAFYFSLENADIDSIMLAWEESPEIVCIHPDGFRLVGPAAVRDSWASRFKNAPELQFTVSVGQVIRTENLCVRLVHEFISIPGNAPSSQPQPIAATNIYRKKRTDWKMVVHHASPAANPPAITLTPKRKNLN